MTAFCVKKLSVMEPSFSIQLHPRHLPKSWFNKEKSRSSQNDSCFIKMILFPP